MTLYESEATLGGHTLTDDSSGYPVDLGFQVGDKVLGLGALWIWLWVLGTAEAYM